MPHSKTPKKPRKVLPAPRTAGYSPPVIDTWGVQMRDLPTFNFNTIRAMLWDPTIRLGLAMRAAPVANCEFAYKDGDKWVEGVKADVGAVGTYVHQQLRRIWTHDIFKILKAQIWGWTAGEWCVKADTRGCVEVDTLLTRHASDVRHLESNGKPWGVRFRRIGNLGQVDLPFPAAFWHAYLPDDGIYYGSSVLRGAYSPWADKWLDGGALDVRRLFAHKDAYGGVDMTYPEGVQEVDDGQGGFRTIPNQDIARQIAEQIKAGGTTTRPAKYDDKGNMLWTLTRAAIPANPSHIFNYPKDLDVEMLRGLEIPDDVLTSEGMSGAWAGKAVPQQAFYMGLTQWLNSIVADLVKNLLEPLVLMRFGYAAEFEVTTKPLAEMGEKPGGQDKGSAGPIVNPWASFLPPPPANNQQTMSLDPVGAVGEGVLSAAELVKAARHTIKRRTIRMAVDAAGHEHKGKGPGGGQFVAKGRGGNSAPDKNASAKPASKSSATAAARNPQSATSKRSKEKPLSEKAARAKANHKLVDASIQRYAEEHNEPRFAKAIGGVSFPDGEPIDVAIAGENGVVAHGIELKTMVDNSNNKITMKRSAMERKAAWERKNRAPVHTVVIDDSAVFNANGEGQHDESKRRIFYRRGYGSFRVGTMHEAKNIAELKQLMGMAEAQLPPAARRPAGQRPGRLAA